MNAYQRAESALKEAVITALREDNIDINTLTELWRHFLGVQAIAKQLKDVPSDSDSLPLTGPPLSSEYYDPDYNISSDLYNFDAIQNLSDDVLAL